MHRQKDDSILTYKVTNLSKFFSIGQYSLTIDLLKLENDCINCKLRDNAFHTVAPLYSSFLFSASVLGRGI